MRKTARLGVSPLVLLAAAACGSDATTPVSPVPHGSLASATASVVPAGTVTVSELQIVRQGENSTPTGSWVLYTRSGSATGEFVAGPGSPSAGTGSLRLTTPTSADKVFLFNFDHVGTPLADISALGYSTFRTVGSLQQVTALNIQVDVNGADVGGFTTLVFEPVYNTAQGAVTSGAWQTWDALASGDARWWSTRAIPGVCAFDCFVSWNTILASNPDAVILGGIGVNQGSGNPALDVNVDAFTVGISGATTTYDFEAPTMLGSCYVSNDEAAKVATLGADCVTDETILVPDAWTLDGNGHSITAIDPVGGHFLGAVVRNAGAVANVRNLTVTVSNLADACDGSGATPETDHRLRGILLAGASGEITGNSVTGIRQGTTSGCQEGSGIEVRNAPFDATGIDVTVLVADNAVTGYQKTGISVNGSVAATVTGNVVVGDGPIDYIAQNGIQVAFGATATLHSNTVRGNDYTPRSFVACGVLFYEADGVRAFDNPVSENERNLCNFGKGGGSVDASN